MVSARGIEPLSLFLQKALTYLLKFLFFSLEDFSKVWYNSYYNNPMLEVYHG